eukprot:GHRR01021047.1.p1 GENE.GHRR01021047.1~~GHRR01021047.1.p1  ORF type:complete len:290 (+),score=110.19 GHRR01021047.1:1062-1931(+)
MADHVDLILVFFDPIGQATCRRTMEVVEQLNHTHHLEKIHYFMSKADEVLDERDRQRVLIQITQNLATRIRNSHAFNLPTFYLPHEDDGGLPCYIPNAIEDVCTGIDKAINQTVQKTLRQLKSDCATIQKAIQQRKQQDAVQRDINSRRALNGVALLAAMLSTLLLLLAMLAARGAGALCGGGNSSSYGGIAATDDSSSRGACATGYVQVLGSWDASMQDSFGIWAGVLLAVCLALAAAAKVAWRHEPVLDRKQIKKLDEYSAVISRVAQQAEVLYEEYFRTLTAAGER